MVHRTNRNGSSDIHQSLHHIWSITKKRITREKLVASNYRAGTTNPEAHKKTKRNKIRKKNKTKMNKTKKKNQQSPLTKPFRITNNPKQLFISFCDGKAEKVVFRIEIRSFADKYIIIIIN